MQYSITAFLMSLLVSNFLYQYRNKYAEQVMLAVTAGGFLYIATVNILPIILMAHHEVDNESAKKSNFGDLIQVFLEGSGFALGIYFMVLVASMEESSGHHH